MILIIICNYIIIIFFVYALPTLLSCKLHENGAIFALFITATPGSNAVPSLHTVLYNNCIVVSAEESGKTS